MVVDSPRHLVVGTRSMTEYFYQLSIGYGSVVPSVFGKHALAMVVQGLASEWTEHAVELGDRKQMQNIYKHERWFAKKPAVSYHQVFLNLRALCSSPRLSGLKEPKVSVLLCT